MIVFTIHVIIYSWLAIQWTADQLNADGVIIRD